MPDYNHDPFIEQIASELRRPVRVDSRFDERVMAALHAPTVIPLRTGLRQSWRDRRWTISVTPLGGLAAAAVIGMFAWLGVRGALEQSPSSVAGAAAIQMRTVASTVESAGSSVVETQFTLFLPEATSVALIGDFNGWDAARAPMQRLNAEGMWAISLPLSLGRHEYQFLVDGERHVNDPTAPQATSDFDSPNSVLTVTPRNE